MYIYIYVYIYIYIYIYIYNFNKNLVLWNELIKVELPRERFRKLTFRTVFRLVTTSTNKSTVLQWKPKWDLATPNLFVGFIENKFFSNYHGQKPDLYKRYIDDCVGATSSSRIELNLSINSVNSFHPALKYTWEIS